MAKSSSRRYNGLALFLAVIILALATLVQRQCAGNNTAQAERGLPRTKAWLHYSAHAKCRMKCRRITQAEVEEILEHGKINYNKSDLKGGEPCSRKYAVEGRTADGQDVRIIFAPCNKRTTVVTTIDLDNDYDCDCK